MKKRKREIASSEGREGGRQNGKRRKRKAVNEGQEREGE
jgi:hypothetical protein